MEQKYFRRIMRENWIEVESGKVINSTYEKVSVTEILLKLVIIFFCNKRNNRALFRIQNNMENINAVLINEGISQKERLMKLNKIAIRQMKILQDVQHRKLLK
jgi:superfamily II DNA/RNA helicase